MDYVISKIKDGKIEVAINELLRRYRGTRFEKELIIYSTQENINKRNNRSGTIDIREYSINQNRIISNLLELISEIKKEFGEKLIENETEISSRKILFCETNPYKEKNLYSNIELRELRKILSTSSGKMKLDVRLGLGLENFIKSINETRPDIVHFISYSDSEGIFFHDNEDNAEYIKNELVERFISIVAGNIDCLFFNTFVSEKMAQRISVKDGIIVIGFNGVISSMGAIEFSTGFYKSLKNGNTYKDSYEIGHKILEGGYYKDMAKKLYAYIEGKKI